LETNKRLNRVAELIDGFETPFGMELLSTVHWIIKDDGTTAKDIVVEHMYDWGENKRKFSPRQIEIAIECLSRNGWINTQVN